MERPVKRQKLSFASSQPVSKIHGGEDEELSCTHADAKTGGPYGRPVVPTSNPNQHDLSRGYNLNDSGKNARIQLQQKPAPLPIVPRAPDTTVLATAVNVNVQNGSTTIANTVVLGTDATVVSFTSIGVLTVSAQTTAPSTSLPSATISDSQTNISPLPSGLTTSLTTSISPTMSVTPG